MSNDDLSDPLIEKDEAELLQNRPTSKLVKILFIFQFISLCLLPATYSLGYSQGSWQLPKLPTNRMNLDLMAHEGRRNADRLQLSPKMASNSSFRVWMTLSKCRIQRI